MNMLERGKFYEFDQNNSGGSFVVDDKVCHRLFIEAPNLTIAVSIAEGFGCYWNGCDDGIDCSCCGDRWYKPWDDKGITFPYEYDKNKVFETPEDYCQMLANDWGWTSPDCRIFYMDGKVSEIFSSKKKPKDRTYKK